MRETGMTRLRAPLAAGLRGVLLIVLLTVVPGIGAGFSAESSTGAGRAALAAVDTITILPVALPEGYEVEDREKLEGEIYKMLVRKLALKGYVLDRARNWQRPEPWTSEAIAAMSREELAVALPAVDGVVAVLRVESVTQKGQVVQSEARSAVSVTLMAPVTGEVVWRNRGEGRFYENLFSGWLVMLITPDRTAALEKAFSKLFEDLPEKP